MITHLSGDQIKKFDTWNKAEEFLTSLKGRWVFRGVSNAEWDLLTSLDRAAQCHHASAERVLAERGLIESFERSLPNVKKVVPPVSDRVSWLALMRHYGLPSRLLDCTECILVASYFAAAGEPKSDFAIWAFDTEILRRSVEERLGILGSANAPLSALELGTDPTFTTAFNNLSLFIAHVDVNFKSDRQQAQKGSFLCPGRSDFPFWRNLMDVPTAQASGALYQIILPSSTREQVMAELDDKGINHEELLPGPLELEALCAELGKTLTNSQGDYGHLQWKLEVLPQIETSGLKAQIVTPGPTHLASGD